MKRMTALAVLFAVGCITAKPGSEEVRLTSNPQATAGCRFLANVEAANGFGGIETRMKNEGAAVGANLVYLLPMDAMLGSNVGVVRGEAYRCEQPKP